MIKNILFVAATFISVGLVAQTFELRDVNDNSIVGVNHYEYGTGSILSSTKFHVKNLSGASASYTADVQEITNSPAVDLQVCYGTACYIGTAGVSSVQQIGDQLTIAAGGVDNTFKVAPFAFAWTVGDSAVWKVIVRNTINPSDTVSSYITWKFRLTGDINGDGVIGPGEIAGDINGDGVIGPGEIAGDVTGDGVIGSGEKMGDVDGNGVIDGNEIWGDANGNGIIDNGEIPLAVNQIDGNDINLTAYPNPATDVLTVEYAIKENANNLSLSVYDVLGQEIMSRKLPKNKGEVDLGLEKINAGMYFYAIKTEGKTIRTERFIVK